MNECRIVDGFAIICIVMEQAFDLFVCIVWRGYLNAMITENAYTIGYSPYGHCIVRAAFVNIQFVLGFVVSTNANSFHGRRIGISALEYRVNTAIFLNY